MRHWLLPVKAVQITGPRRAEIIELPLPALKPGDVQVKLQKTCLCGSDIPYFAYDQQEMLDDGFPNCMGHIVYDGSPVYPLPVGLSLHECVGVVTDSKSDRFKPGDFVLALPYEQYGFIEYLTLPDERIFSLPTGSVSKEEILLSQPLGTLLFGFRMMPELKGKTVAILGQGPIGLMFNTLVKRAGAAQVIGVDRLAYRLETGRLMGADSIINASDIEASEGVAELTDGAMADVVIEAVGHAELTLDTAINLAGFEGTVMAFGVVDYETVDRFPLGTAFKKNLTIKNTVGAKDGGYFLEAARMIDSGEFDFRPLLTHSLPFDQVQRAYELFVDRDDGAIKVVIDFESIA